MNGSGNIQTEKNNKKNQNNKASYDKLRESF